jgi:hypothetical protein
VKLRPYTKQAIKWLTISLLLYAITIVVSQVAFAQMIAGAGYAVAFGAIMIVSTMATIALGVSAYFGILTSS